MKVSVLALSFAAAQDALDNIVLPDLAAAGGDASDVAASGTGVDTAGAGGDTAGAGADGLPDLSNGSGPPENPPENAGDATKDGEAEEPTKPPTTPKLPLKLNWGSDDIKNPCGSMIEFDEDIVNKTCTITYNFGEELDNVHRIFIGGAFIVPSVTENVYKITGFEGINPPDKYVDVLGFWTQEEDANQNVLNDTCKDAAFFDLECEDNLAALTGPYFMETANDFRMGKGSTYNFQIWGAEVGKILTIKLLDAENNPFSCLEMTSNAGIITLGDQPDCNESKDPATNGTSVSCASGELIFNLAEDGEKPFCNECMFTFSCVQDKQQPAEPNLWKSTVVMT